MIGRHLGGVIDLVYPLSVRVRKLTRDVRVTTGIGIDRINRSVRGAGAVCLDQCVGVSSSETAFDPLAVAVKRCIGKLLTVCLMGHYSIIGSLLTLGSTKITVLSTNDVGGFVAKLFLFNLSGHRARPTIRFTDRVQRAIAILFLARFRVFVTGTNFHGVFIKHGICGDSVTRIFGLLCFFSICRLTRAERNSIFGSNLGLVRAPTLWAMLSSAG